VPGEIRVGSTIVVGGTRNMNVGQQRRNAIIIRRQGSNLVLPRGGEMPINVPSSMNIGAALQSHRGNANAAGQYRVGMMAMGPEEPAEDEEEGYNEDELAAAAGFPAKPKEEDGGDKGDGGGGGKNAD